MGLYLVKVVHNIYLYLCVWKSDNMTAIDKHSYSYMFLSFYVTRREWEPIIREKKQVPTEERESERGVSLFPRGIVSLIIYAIDFRVQKKVGEGAVIFFIIKKWFFLFFFYNLGYIWRDKECEATAVCELTPRSTRGHANRKSTTLTQHYTVKDSGTNTTKRTFNTIGHPL